MLIEKVLYRARVKATTGRDIRAVSSEGVPDLKVTRQPQLGGTNGRRTNPEQLFVASFSGIMRLVAGREGIELPTNTDVEASIRVGPAAREFGIEVELRIGVPVLPRAEADSLGEKSHALCPYANATRGNISLRPVLA
jgi:lipoyl-dependent peroxiredoxin